MGHRAAARKVLAMRRDDGPRPQQAVAELFSALDAVMDARSWPGPRDPVSEANVERVRRRWAVVQRHARRARSR